jgi:glycosyltransferase involved in cell wall biosynthesis
VKIVVLMSTYNGQRYVAEQLRSILSQLNPNDQVLIRDDGSSDGTVVEVERFADPRVSLFRGENVGFCRSFFMLMNAVPSDADLIFLSDQDDVWLPNKVARVCAVLAGKSNLPAAYSGRMILVDAELQAFGSSPEFPRGASFENALAENVLTGCAAAFNKRALALIREHGSIDLVHFHDWWIYLVVSAFGEIVTDSVPTVMYRQHQENVIGMGQGWGRIVSVVRFLLKENWVRIMYAQAENFRCVYGSAIACEKRVYLERYFDRRDWRSALRLILSMRRFRQRRIDELLLRVLVGYALVSGKVLVNGRESSS